MKKQAFGMVTALFALMLALFMGAYAADTSAAELSAANTAYAILYEDGTLVFQNSNTPDGRAVKATYEVDLSAHYTEAPWYKERNSISAVNFTDKISPASTAYWFCFCSELERMDNIWNLDTANVTDMTEMFSYCGGLTALDVSNFNTANVTNMRHMFYSCYGLEALDVAHFNTANVTNMSGMFASCRALTALDVSHFDTTNVTDMSYMFVDCSGLTALDLSRFNTANVTNMWNMFSGCSGLTTLDISGWNTANVTDMHSMFGQCEKLTVLDVSHFDTTNVTDMSNMFALCRELTALDLSHFNTANVTNMRSMFDECYALTALDLSHFNTANVTDMHRMFYGYRLTTLNLSGWNTANVTDMGEMFLDCSRLIELDLSGWDTANVMDMTWMFWGCSNLKTIYVSDKFTTTLVEELDWIGSHDMFAYCTSLVGGNGTKFDETHTDKEYARIDALSAPGYFTVPYAIIAAAPDNGKLSVTLTNPDAATLAVSYFDASGKFVSVNLQDVSANAGTAESSIPANATTARVMLLDDDFRPLCAARPATI